MMTVLEKVYFNQIIPYKKEHGAEPATIILGKDLYKKAYQDSYNIGCNIDGKIQFRGINIVESQENGVIQLS